MDMKIGLVHATMNCVEPILEAFRIHAPGVGVLNFMDEGLLDEVNKTGTVTPALIRRLVNLIDIAEKSGVDGILLTCSSFSPFVEDIKGLFTVPVLSADISMLEHAVKSSGSIGVIATVGAAGPTTTQLLKDMAKNLHKDITVHTEVITEAFSALKNGDGEKHDELIQNKIFELANQCDVVVLAQMSMARAIKNIKTVSKPVLTSPEISVKAIVSEVTKIIKKGKLI